MGDTEDPTRDQVLGAVDPTDLFGDADGRALKRAYARLIRRFGPDHEPEAFEHIRALYEMAKSGPPVEDPAAAEVPRFEPPETSAPTAESALSALYSALDDEDWPQVARHVDEGAGRIVQLSSELWLDAVLAITEACLEDTSVSTLQDRLRTIDALPYDFDLDQLQEVEELLLTTIEFKNASADSKTNKVLLDAIHSARVADPLQCAQIWHEAQETLGGSTALESDVTRLLHRYPLVFRCLCQVNARITDAEHTHRLWLTGRANKHPRIKNRGLRGALSPSIRATIGGVPGALWVVISMVGGVASLALSAWLANEVWGTKSSVVLSTVAVTIFTLWLIAHYRPPPPIRTPSRWTPELREQVIQTLRGEVLWPHELIGSVMYRWEDQGQNTDGTLIDLEQDRSLLLACMSEAHIARTEQRLREEEEQEEEQEQ